ncbi:PDZ domain containing protein 7 [Dissostichus eleginoides]|uniref:PDZ domain containing protein 7 n=1 Tax=Dissostichus eleginoides TaxID=100907 RepID=A0AAD9FB84_DISEL|nr:PDZ domain containing protein 7 [Dissostichus eleginoides]
MTTNWNELNVSRAQWSIDSYCLGNTDDKCQPCQFGWFLSQPSCYAINDPPSPEEITEEADYVNAPEGPADKKATRPESNVKDLNAEIKTLTTQKDGLTKQIQEMETNWNELNVSRAQWSINEYCKLGEGMLRNH